MKKLIAFNFLVGFLFIALPPYRSAYARPEPIKATVVVKPPTINDLIALNAVKYHVSATVMHKVIKCESSYNTKAVGDHGHSYGLVQIHLPSNLKVTKAQAVNPQFAIDFLAKGLSKHQGNKWTCFRNLNRV